MFSQLKEKIGYVRGERFRAVPIKDSNGGASMNDRVPEMNFGRREVENGGDAEGN